METQKRTKKPAWIRPGCTAAVAALLLMSITAFAPASADDEFPIDIFDHRREVTVENPGDLVTGYQVQVTLDTATEIAEGRMRSDCADVRFRDALGLVDLPYFLEEGCGTDGTLFYVRTNVLLSGENSLHVYFGNSKAESQSDPSATFTVYQDFEDGDSDGWEAMGGAQIIGVTDGALQVATSGTAQAALYTQAEMTRDHRVEATLNIAPGINQGGYAGLGFLATDNDNTYISRSTSISRIGLIDGGSYTGLTGGDLVETGSFLEYAVWFDDATIHASINGNAVSVSNTAHDSGHVGIASWWGLSGEHALDSIRVISDADPAPVASVGDLEDCTANLLCS